MKPLSQGASWALAWAAPAAVSWSLSPGLPEGLAGTLLFLPAVVGALLGAHRLAGRRQAPLGFGLGAGGFAFLAAAVARSALPFATTLAALVLLVGLFVAVVFTLLELRRGLQRGPDPARLAAFGLTALAVYSAQIPWHLSRRAPDGDEPFYLLLAWSLWEDRDLDLADDYREGAYRLFGLPTLEPQPGDPQGPRGERYSRHDPFYPLWLAAFLGVGGVGGARFGTALLAALGSMLFLSCARSLPGVTERGAFRAWTVFSFLSPWPLYATQIWVEVPAATLLLASLFGWLRRGGDNPSPDRQRLLSWLPFAGLGGLVLLKLRFALLAIPYATVALFRGSSTRGFRQRIFLGLLLLLGTVLAFNWWTLGNPLRIYGPGAVWPEGQSLAALLRGILGLFLDRSYGLLAVAPLCLLALPELLGPLARPRRHPLGLFLWASLPYLLAIASRREWYGGWSPPFRYAIVLLPLLLLAWAPALSRPGDRLARLLAPAAAASTLFLLGLYTLLPGWAYHLADGGHHLLDFLGPRFEADLLRFLPSAVRPNLALPVWALAGFLLAAPALRQRRPRRPRGRALTPASLALLLGALGSWLLAAHTLPTRRLEMEDPHVRSRGAGIYPERWLPDRTRFRGGLLLPEGAEAWFRPVSGGERVSLVLHGLLIRNDPTPLAVELFQGSELLARLEAPREGEFSAIQLGPFDWQPGLELRFRIQAPAGSPPRNGIVLDRVEFSWK